MERNRWETALRCLEVALHPNTRDDEIVAAVHGFRRTTDGARLRDIVQALATPNARSNGAVSKTEILRAKVERLERQNRELSQRLDTEVAERAKESRQLWEAELRAHQLNEAYRAAARRVDEIAQQLVAARAAQRASTKEVAPPSSGPNRASIFQALLSAARERNGEPDPFIAIRTTAPNPRTPWMA